jgi:predicted transcriptional regulator
MQETTNTEYVPVSRATATWGIMRSAWAVNRRLREEGRTDGASVQEVFDHVLTHRARPIAYPTVASHLLKLRAKDLVLSKKKGRLLYYRPVLDELVVVGAEIHSFLDHVIHDSPELLDELERQLLERRYDLQARERQKHKRRSEAS